MAATVSCDFGLGSNNGTSSRNTIRTHGTRTQSFFHGSRLYRLASWTSQQWGVILGTEFDIYEVVFPADWAVSRVLSAH